MKIDTKAYLKLDSDLYLNSDLISSSYFYSKNGIRSKRKRHVNCQIEGIKVYRDLDSIKRASSFIYILFIERRTTGNFAILETSLLTISIIYCNIQP